MNLSLERLNIADYKKEDVGSEFLVIGSHRDKKVANAFVEFVSNLRPKWWFAFKN